MITTPLLYQAPTQMFNKKKHQSTSYGVILLYCRSTTSVDNVTEPSSKQWYTIVNERNHSYSFSEFLRGKFTLEGQLCRKSHTSAYFDILFERMTVQEQNILIKLYDNTPRYQMEATDNQFLDQIYNQDQLRSNIEKLNKQLGKHLSLLSSKNYEFCEIGFPKGKRSRKETYLECAKRECFEETGIRADQYTILQENNASTRNRPVCIEEEYVSTNNIKYKNIYYVGILKEYQTKFPLGSLQLKESKNVMLVPLNKLDQMPYTRPYEIYRKDTIVKIKDMINKELRPF